MPIRDPLTGDVPQAQLLVTTLGSGNYTFAEASLAQDLPFWIETHVHVFEVFGGFPQILSLIT